MPRLPVIYLACRDIREGEPRATSGLAGLCAQLPVPGCILLLRPSLADSGICLSYAAVPAEHEATLAQANREALVIGNALQRRGYPVEERPAELGRVARQTLRELFPAAALAVIQLSLGTALSDIQSRDLGAFLLPWRDQGWLALGLDSQAGEDAAAEGSNAAGLYWRQALASWIDEQVIHSGPGALLNPQSRAPYGGRLTERDLASFRVLQSVIGLAGQRLPEQVVSLAPGKCCPPLSGYFWST
ncbi:hypothetical protein QEP21_00030 [Pseudomonas shirazica]|uniref:hypothetical protein n=1 Tax=Pseudomonas shirazica TaxID=1940636 RepID=UPI002452EE04|nr:hypothetical protein [Pseudomonas shirazica]MDH4428750.1 hypothetical protein [Pseudomonas shirazica]